MPPGGSTQENSELPTGSPASLLQECLACGVLVVNARGRIAACTPEAAAHLRAKTERLRNAPVNSLPAPLPRLIRDAAKSGQPLTNLEVLLKTSRRGDTTLRASILPVKTRTHPQVVVVLNNLTSAPVFEQNMRRLDRLASLGTLSASMAHEIKNGMVAIKTFVDLLLQKGQDTELTEVVSRELQRINAIVTQMMRFAAPKGAAFTTVHVHELLDHSLRVLHHQITGKSISLQRRYAARMDAVRGDDAQLQQVFINLLLNALEAMDMKGVLTVATETDGGQTGNTRPCTFTFRTPAWALRGKIWDGCLSRFSQPRKTAPDWGWPSASASRTNIGAPFKCEAKSTSGSTFSLSLPVPFLTDRPLSKR